MKKPRSSLLLCVLGSAAIAAGCSTASTTPSTGTGGKSGTGGSTGGGTGGQVSTGASVSLIPSASGFIAADSNSLGVVGAWYAYGDGYENGAPPGKCQMAGHTAAQCSVITAPTLPPGVAGFPPTAGAMCTTGMVPKVIAITGMTALDYSNMYGAGIGVDLNNPGGGANTVKGVFNATAKGVTGISFDLDAPPLSGLRVEFPTTATDGSVAGSDYWGATPTGSFPNSPVKAGPNTIHFATDVNTPAVPVAGAPAHVFNPSLLESVQFHVPTNMTMGSSYTFCISNLKLLM